MTEWLLIVILVSTTGVTTQPVGTFTSSEICRQAREAAYQTGLYVPSKDGTGRLLYCAPRPKK